LDRPATTAGEDDHRDGDSHADAEKAHRTHLTCSSSRTRFRISKRTMGTSRTQRYNERMPRDDYRNIPQQIKKVEAAIKSRKAAQLYEAIDSAMLALEMRETDMMIGIASADDKPSNDLRKLVKSAQALVMKL
jgi:hypothetical protein